MIHPHFHRKTWISAWLPPLIWAVVIFLFSSQSGLPGPDDILLDFIFKKSAHIFVFGVLYILVWRATHMSLRPRGATFGWLLPLVICLCYAGLDELHQSLTPGRSATIRDVGYDLLGMIIASAWWYRYFDLPSHKSST